MHTHTQTQTLSCQWSYEWEWSCLRLGLPQTPSPTIFLPEELQLHQCPCHFQTKRVWSESSFPAIYLTPSIFHLVSWRQHRSTLLLDTVSTISLAENKVCDSCIASSWALLTFLLCLWWPNSNFLCCVITQNGESSRDLLLSVTNRKSFGSWRAQPTRAPPAPPPYKTFITLLPVTYSQLDPQLGVYLRKKVSTLIGYLLTDCLNCLTVNYLAGWHLE